MSPFCNRGARSSSVPSTAAAGIISQTTRGVLSCLTNLSSDEAPVAPSPANCFTLASLLSYTTHSWPPRNSRRTMLAPIRPKPIIPYCIVSLRLAYGLRDGFRERLQVLLHVRPQVRPQRAAFAFGQNLEITARLRSLHHTESIFLARHRQIVRVVAGNLEEHARIRAALVSLPGGMQKARAEADAGGHFLSVANRHTHLLQYGVVLRVHL